MEMIEIVKSEIIDKEEKQTPGNGEVLKPGSKIKPDTSYEDVEKLVERLYGITTSDIKELRAYDDRNYLIHEDRNMKNPLITNSWPYGYVLKIMNAHDSQKLDFVDAQTQLLIFLRKQNISCPCPVKNVYGKYFSVEVLNGSRHVVRLLEFLQGKIFHEVPKNNYLFYQAGEFVGLLDVALKKFDHETYKTHKTLWMLESVPKLKDFLYVLQDHGRKEMVEQVISTFESKVLSQLDSFEKSIIHGDFNEQNILVKEIKEEYKISGILDFGDTSYSPLVFELAIAMTYMMLQTTDLATGGLVIAGYSSVRNIPQKELNVLKECVSARLAQSLVLGAYTHSLDTTNDYLLITQKAGWELLELLWKENFDKVDEIWFNIADNYLKQSVK